MSSGISDLFDYGAELSSSVQSKSKISLTELYEFGKCLTKIIESKKESKEKRKCLMEAIKTKGILHGTRGLEDIEIFLKKFEISKPAKNQVISCIREVEEKLIKL